MEKRIGAFTDAVWKDEIEARFPIQKRIMHKYNSNNITYIELKLLYYYYYYFHSCNSGFLFT